MPIPDVFLATLLQPIETALQQESYGEVVRYCEEQLVENPECLPLYGYLGLALLLQGQEAEAQMSWLVGLEAAQGREGERGIETLVTLLSTEADRQEAAEHWPMAWTIRQHIREIDAANIANLLRLIHCSLQAGTFAGEFLSEWGIIATLQAHESVELSPEQVFPLLKQIFEADPYHPACLEFAALCFRHCPQISTRTADIVQLTLNLAKVRRRPDLAIVLSESYLEIDPDNRNLIRALATQYQDAKLYEQGIAMAQRCYDLAPSLIEKVFANHLLTRGVLGTGGRWAEGYTLLQHQESLLNQVLAAPADEISIDSGALFLTNSTFFSPYFQDTPRHNHDLRRRVMQRFQQIVERDLALHELQADHHWQRRSPAQRSPQKRPLKVGYLSYCMTTHSVGWLARWLIQHHDRQCVELYGYFINYREVYDPIQAWYTEQMTHVRRLGTNPGEIAMQIYQDGIDILVDLDSITLDITCQIMAVKPAPIQITWLGWDASGLPTVDYFMADPYVLPENAQDYYQEKIWRLPQTYIAVDGFEIGVPDLRRDTLAIPADAVVYLTGQSGPKWNPMITRLQLQILQAVPDSYFLIKGLAADPAIQQTFCAIAEEMGVSRDRLRFLPPAPNEATHRANLGIIDVALDTYPYNGATTTLETLWVGIPLVTRVGEQFAARNSYTMLVNAGIEEGIAWTDEEYVEWGIRFGMEPELRQKVSWKLRQSRQTAPLWDARQFARDMESAYQQMWEIYCSCQPS
ncbi:O-linked N-acetylglucosamine transferase, SPINDLY family protein [Trichothermofontia sp.]